MNGYSESLSLSDRWKVGGMSAANPIDNEAEAEEPDCLEEEYTFHVDLPGLTIVEVPGEGVKVEIDYDFHEHEIIVSLLGTLDLRIDDGYFDLVRGTYIYTTTRR